MLPKNFVAVKPPFSLGNCPNKCILKKTKENHYPKPLFDRIFVGESMFVARLSALADPIVSFNN